MSAIVGILLDDQVMLGSDTLACKPWEEGELRLTPAYFTSKVYHVPHLKSLFGITGFHFIGNTFYDFLRQYIGLDIRSILEIDLAKFAVELRKVGIDDAFGTIFLYGFDDKESIFKGYYLFMDLCKTDFQWKKLPSFKDGELLTKPAVSGITNKMELVFQNEELNAKSIIKRAISIQKSEDDQRLASQQVGIGGDIVWTWMGYNGSNFSIISEVIYTFPDKKEAFKIMLEKFNKPS
ncbi:hypothetical protein [Dyadobacter sp. 3J3]|uniref:hypothetical protein n=1 Tax=Dyadobacter sp. 3J3 TaxID=2606600 RepID=UPI00135B0C96|nr:hypothetical protein [Dyadobacter sp. 3J3]